MKTNETTQQTADSKRKINSALGVRKEVAAKFSKFCRTNGLVIAYAAEQALAAWMREQERTGAKTK